MKHTIKGFLVYDHASWVAPKDRVCFQCCEPWETQNATLIGPHEFEVDVPDDFDPRPAQIAALQEKRRQAQADFAKLCTDIQRQISELTCLEAS